ncbi:HlyD family efflux transporter periplasmic adaptor subunit [Allorhodopirellula heiligendammensis]|uniref:Peptide zinc metalloprotease protein YydH n=1 Tax=Allorhodopirellula heiligendammensis TaxID=2714739 RepID=A0A5C6BCD6_9BACT|nr:HlyD family efflux transporter periplasmic adaptor subunit [Allorhodopirellula heiligendammensis]TWU09763.1 putative peptide zinc metalloprotease protein YydH [Allorhodopirellula heiligendammensis]
MTTLAESLVSSSSRALTVRRRPDLTASRHHYQGQGYWVMKEPVGLQYFRFHDEEYFILNMLDGHVSLQQIKDGFEQRFAPQKITFGDLQQFIGMLHRSGLVISNSPGQGKSLRERGRTKKNKELLGKMSNVFAVRFRGIDPEKILNRLLPIAGWIFTVPALIFFACFLLSAALLLATQYQTVYAKLPTFHQFFAADRWIILAATMAIVKVIHEFGHGLSCKKFGGECHEIGFMLLVFTPCLYCNVSDSWMLPNKWKRIWIGAGGIYVEMILASIAAYVWFFSESGTTINDLCLNMMFLNVVSTVLVNGNPLLRFDGYYILMDYLEIPNLRQKSTEVLKRWFQETCLGLELQDDPFLPQRNRFLFGMFTIASVIYRWVVVFSIVWFVMQVLEPYGLQALGRILAVIGFSGLVAQPIIQTWKFIRTPGRLAKVKRGPLLTSLAVAGVVIAAVCYIPLPHHIDAAFEIRPSRAGTVYAGTVGRIVETVPVGTRVSQGEPIAVLDDPELKIRLAVINGEERFASVQLQNLKLRAQEEPAVVAQIETQEEMLQSILSLKAKTQEEVDRLTIRAKQDGFVLPPPERPSNDPGDGRLPGWTGTPLQIENRGALLTADDMICEIGAPDGFEAVLIIDQGDRQLVREDQAVDLKLDSLRLQTFHGKIEEISKKPMDAASTSMSSQTGGDLQTEIDPKTGQVRPRSVSYQARVPLDSADMLLRPGYRGAAKVHVDPMSLGQRLWRVIIKTFNFDF